MKKTDNVYKINTKSTDHSWEENAAKIILKALDLKDSYTFGHSMRVAYFCKVTGTEMGLDENEIKELELAGLFHDIGKIGTPDEVLNKPSRLSEEEFQVMKKHPDLSFEILNEFPSFHKIAHYAHHHHERYDGRGYPSGMKGDEIPLFSRIILIADTFDAMTSTRTYRKGLSYDIAFEELIQFSGTQFDPYSVNMFIEGMRKEALKNEEEFHITLLDKKFKKIAA